MSLKRKLIISALVFFTSPFLILINEVIWYLIFLISFGSTIYYTIIRIKLFSLSFWNRFKKKELFIRNNNTKSTKGDFIDFVNIEINWEIPNRYNSSNTKATEFYNSSFLPWNTFINCTYPQSTPRDDDASCFVYLSICPHCWFNFEKIVTRKRKCPNCKNDIFRNRFPNERCMKLVKKDLYDEMQKEWDKVLLIERFFISNEELEKVEKRYLDLNSFYKKIEKIILLRMEFFKLNSEIENWRYWMCYNMYSHLLLKYWMTQNAIKLINSAEHNLIVNDYVSFVDWVLRDGFMILEKEFLSELLYKKFNRIFIEINKSYKYYLWNWFLIISMFRISSLPRLLGYNWIGNPQNLVIEFLKDFKIHCEKHDNLQLYSIVEYLIYVKFFDQETDFRNPIIKAIKPFKIDQDSPR